ncbi:MAG TPA: hypothetical protein VNN18_06090 [Candidatus Xenobia bacterium]|nr:hypothetical protein [Candidatus Xenobia bacterium]
MTLRGATGGILVGVAGLAGLTAAFAIEHFAVGQVRTFLAAHPEALPVSANQAMLGLMALTLWMGLIYAAVFEQAYPHSISASRAVTFGTLHWLGVAVPALAVALLWTGLPPAGLAAVLLGWMIELVGGSFLLARLLKMEKHAA